MILLAKLGLPLGVVGVISAGGSDVFTVLAILAGLLVISVSGFFTIRAKNAEWWRESYEGLQAAHKELVREMAEYKIELAAAEARVKLLESQPSYEVLVSLLSGAQAQGAAEHAEMIKQLGAITTILERLK